MRSKILYFFLALRPHQWVKNLLLFVPLLLAHQHNNLPSLAILLLAFISFGLGASSVYVINDLLDLDNDRNHPRKRYRPFAASKLPITSGFVIVPILIIISIVLGALVGIEFLIILFLYLLLTMTYSLVFKRLILVDCLMLAAFYTLRIVAGAKAVSVTVSFWLLMFSVFIFLSLAFVKRYVELVAHSKKRKNIVKGRGYVASDASILQTLGVSSGYISVFILALYTQSEEAVLFYEQSKAVWFIIPIILFWISWIWLKAARGEMHDDPVVFATKDKVSLLLLGAQLVVIFYLLEF